MDADAVDFAAPPGTSEHQHRGRQRHHRTEINLRESHCPGYRCKNWNQQTLSAVDNQRGREQRGRQQSSRGWLGRCSHVMRLS